MRTNLVQITPISELPKPYRRARRTEMSHKAAEAIAHRALLTPEVQELTKMLAAGLPVNQYVELSLAHADVDSPMRIAMVMAVETAVKEFQPTYTCYAETDDTNDYVMVINLDKPASALN